MPFCYLSRSIPRSEPRHARTSVWALSISLAATLEIDVSFSSSGYLDVSVHRVPLHTLWIHAWIRKGLLRGFPHSDICGSWNICFSPQLFAAYHVFRRLLVPRHPPCALISLTCRSQTFFTGICSLTPIALGARHRFVYNSSLHSLYHFHDTLGCLSLIFLDFSVFGFQGTVFFAQTTLFPSSAMETERFELLTPCLQGRCSPN